MTCTGNLLPALEVQLRLPPEEWARAVTARHLDEPNKAYLREEYRRWRMSRGMSRRTDPDTSRQAAARAVASGARADHITRIVRAVREHPGRTSAELAKITGFERHEAARRTADAEHQGLIHKGAPRRCHVSGRSAVTWRYPLTAAQRACLTGDAA